MASIEPLSPRGSSPSGVASMSERPRSWMQPASQGRPNPGTWDFCLVRASMRADALAEPISACGCCWKKTPLKRRVSLPSSTGSIASVSKSSRRPWRKPRLRHLSRYVRPAFAIALEPGGIGTGSGRSIPGVDIGRTVRRAVQEGLLLKGGGHAMAAGVTLKKDALGAFRAFLEDG